MSYNPYGNFTTYSPYNPYGNYVGPQMPAQQMPVPVQPQPEQKSSNCDFITVSGIQQVKEAVLKPNQTVYFLDANRPIMYKKTAQGDFGSEIHIYRMTQITADELMQSDDQTVPSSVRNEIQALTQRITLLEQQLQGKELSYESTFTKQSDYRNNEYAQEWKSENNSGKYNVSEPGM